VKKDRFIICKTEGCGSLSGRYGYCKICLDEYKSTLRADERGLVKRLNDVRRELAKVEEQPRG